jgi:hypothetical protein
MRKLWCGIKEWKQELVGILIALALFLLSPIALRLIDPTAGTFDIGILQPIIFATVAILTFSFLSWVGLKVNFNNVFSYLQDKDFENDFKTLTAWQKIFISVLLYFFYLLLFIVVASQVM